VSGGAALRRELLGNQVELFTCPDCGTRWCCAINRGEPAHAAGVVWPHSAGDWQKVYDLDDGVSLRRWFVREIRQAVKSGRPCGQRACRFGLRRRAR
jgi:hypothetical protein